MRTLVVLSAVAFFALSFIWPLPEWSKKIQNCPAQKLAQSYPKRQNGVSKHMHHELYTTDAK